MKRKETLKGPEGLQIELDADQIFPGDPGQGTPALVVQRKQGRDEFTGTFNCVSSEGTMENDRGQYLVLSTPKCDWLRAQEEYVDRFITEHTRAMCAAKVKQVAPAEVAAD